MKVGVIGCGSIGTRYVQWLMEMGVDVAACDTNPDNLNAVAGTAASTFSNIDHMFEWGVDKAVVSTPPLHHLEPAMTALHENLDVLIEKPMAANLQHGEDLCAAAARSLGSAWVVCNMRFHPAIQAIALNIAQIGVPLCVRAYFSHRLSQMRPAGTDVYAASTAQGGGVILDCIHEFDVLQWLLGPMKNIRGWRNQIGEDNIQADDVADLQIEFSRGCCGTVHFDFLSRLKRRGLELIGNDATAIWESTGKSPEVCTVTLGTNKNSRVLLSDNNVDGFAPYKEMLKRFIDGGEGLQTIDEALQTLRFGLAASNDDWSQG